MSAIGSQSLSIFESLPSDVLSHIYHYLPDSDKDNFYDLSKYLRQIANEEIDRCLEKLKSHPTLKFILKHTEGSNLRDKVSRVYEFLKHGEQFRDIRSANPNIIHVMSRLQREKIQVQPLDANTALKASNLRKTLRELSDLANPCGNYNTLFLNSILKNEKKLLEQIDFFLVEADTLAEGMLVSVMGDNITVFKKLISFIKKIDTANGSKKLNQFLKAITDLTIIQDRKEMFCYLLSFKMAFPNPDEILFLLAEKNWGEEIEIFLVLNPELNKTFSNTCFSVHGVSSVLMAAALKGNLSALNAILKGIPDAISCEILQDVRHKLFQENPSLNKEEMIDILDQEFARRLVPGKSEV
ncbi:MAG: hypothetical protein K2X08_04595 [Chlamydiales bacterium]|nr:hypothetical protein [Chlamydiales bacterium]